MPERQTSRTARLRRGRLLAAAAALVGVLLACAPGSPPRDASSVAGGDAAASSPKTGGSFTYAMSRDVTRKGLDPNVGGGQPDIVLWMQLFDTLLYQDPRDQTITPGLAERWEVSEDGRVYTFHLRQDVKFHDGTPLDAAAVKFTFDRILDPSNPGISRQQLAEVQSAEVVDDYTVRVTLRNPQPIFPLRLTRPHTSIVSPSAVRALGAEEFGRQPVGSGPFILQEWVPGDRFVLRRNPDYHWGPPFAKHPGPAYLDTLTIRVIPEASVRAAALDSGEVDAIEFVPPQELQRLKDSSAYRVLTTKRAGGPIVLHLNVELPPTDDLAVRRALLVGVDRETINQTAYLGAQFPALGFLQPQMYGYDASLEPRFAYDPEAAKRLLDAAGWRPGPDGIRVRDGRPLELKGIFQGSPALPFELLQAQWRALGVKLDIQTVNAAGYLEAGDRGLGNVYGEVAGGFTNEDPDLLRLIYSCESVGGRNYSRYCNPEFDRLAKEAYMTPFGEQRIVLYHQMQQRLLDDAVAVPFIGDNVHVGLRASAHDLWMNSLGLYPVFLDTWLDR